MRPGEGELLRALRLRALAADPDAFAATEAQERQRAVELWDALVGSSDAAVFVALEGDRWRGMAGARWSDRIPGTVQLWGMWVDPVSRGRGVARELVARVESWASAAGASSLRLGVIDGAGELAELYEHLGFVRTGEHGTLLRDPGATTTFLAKPLTEISGAVL